MYLAICYPWIIFATQLVPLPFDCLFVSPSFQRRNQPQQTQVMHHLRQSGVVPRDEVRYEARA